MSDGSWIFSGLVWASGIICWTVVQCLKIWASTPQIVNNRGRVNNIHMTAEEFAEMEAAAQQESLSGEVNP